MTAKKDIDLGTWKRMQSGASLDTSDLNKKLAALVEDAAPEMVAKALGRAGLELMSDAIEDAPSVPFDESTLQASGSVFVQKELIGTTESQSEAGGKPNPARDHNEPIDRKKPSAIVGFNTPYAARLHEHPEFSFSQERRGTEGGKYLEYPLYANGKLYLEMIGRSIKLDLKAGKA